MNGDELTGIPRQRPRRRDWIAVSVLVLAVIVACVCFVRQGCSAVSARDAAESARRHGELRADSLRLARGAVILDSLEMLVAGARRVSLRNIPEPGVIAAFRVANRDADRGELTRALRRELQRRAQAREKEAERASVEAAAKKAAARIDAIVAIADAQRTIDGGSGAGRASRSRIKALTTKYPSWSDTEVASVACRFVHVGMTVEQLRESWGAPEDINRTVYSFGIHEQWVYGSSMYVYLKDGVVTSWQD